MDIEKRVRICLLYDFYGALLTDKQQYVMKRYFEDDASLVEIADELGISRQAVRDSIVTSESMLDNFESKLELVKRHQKLKSGLMEVVSCIDQNDDVNNIKKLLNDLFQYL